MKRLEIHHPNGVSYAMIDDDTPPEEINEICRIAVNIEEANDGKVRLRKTNTTSNSILI